MVVESANCSTPSPFIKRVNIPTSFITQQQFFNLVLTTTTLLPFFFVSASHYYSPIWSWSRDCNISRNVICFNPPNPWNKSSSVTFYPRTTYTTPFDASASSFVSPRPFHSLSTTSTTLSITTQSQITSFKSRSYASSSSNTFLSRSFLPTLHSTRNTHHHINMDIPTNNKTNIIDGKVIANQIQAELTHQVTNLSEKYNLIPGLAVILIGSRKDSQTYVKMKKKACTQVGIASFGYEFPDTVTQEEILSLIAQLNQDTKVHGILIQLPLPKHLDESLILETVDPNKDVDGLHPVNTALLCSMNTHQRQQQQQSSSMTIKSMDWKDLSSIPFHIPCTPQGCIELLDRSKVELKGKHAVVIGRSNLVGMPVAMLLLHRDATVTVVHSKTINAASMVQQADVVVAAVGRAEMVKKEWIRPGAVIIDVGINSIEDTTDPRGYRLVGDVDYENVKDVAGLITPVPGGVGPMTIAMLLRNTVNSCLRLAGLSCDEGKE